MREAHDAPVMKLALALLLCACGTSTVPAGATCTTASECDSNLSCLDVAEINGSTCTVLGKACSLDCTSDDNVCASLGSNFMCFEGCNATKFCGETGTP